MAMSAMTYKFSLIKTTAQPITIKITVFNSSLADQAILPATAEFVHKHRGRDPSQQRDLQESENVREDRQDSGDTDHQGEFVIKVIVNDHDSRLSGEASLRPSGGVKVSQCGLN
ncbi:hypothetical protein BLNAU_10411 [Blattamonas nauphoetae]|uniref:Uncharacterized protein n=1 Tax=Blattamonas nauphoetae TaxID=2049346 RepID=A0ABQ9XRZ2_9EUKA|nr:hypothetical protein BLNAU_10411 [Blattamonas nauphoetae]